VYMQPTSDALSGSNSKVRLRVIASWIAGLDSLKIALVFVFVAVAWGVDAQTYNVGPDASKSPQAQTNQRSLRAKRWVGDRIFKMRASHAPRNWPCSNGDHALALDYAQRAAQAAPNDPAVMVPPRIRGTA
jgi:hypothetical protein